MGQTLEQSTLYLKLSPFLTWNLTNILRNIDISRIRKKGDFHPLGRLPIHRLNLGVVQEQFVLIDIVIFFHSSWLCANVALVGNGVLQR